MEKVQKAYNEIFNVLNKHRDLCVFDIIDLELKAKIHLFGIELRDKYGLNINLKDVYSLDMFSPKEYIYISWYGDKYGRTIGWSVDGRQPKDELLLQIWFPTGAYIFNDDYPIDLFREFWLELKTFNPNYIDEANHCLYWNIDNAKDIFNSFDSILKKYHEINKEDSLKRKIKKMKEELAKLETNK